MNIYNYEKVRYDEVEKWLKESIPELTRYQIETIKEREIIRFSPFEFFKEKEQSCPNILLRFSIVLLAIVYVLLIINLPLNFIINGRWYYKSKMTWLFNWMHKCGI